ncbi:hypothetical protein IN07_03740 [Modestobacter caceresii]|uniref:Uncharacterized protein n=1 Tax=Modestobacter caceresii TaxID=1522368 RepID=A0A098YCI3_9ACTN|nr:hypothetical protein IN07_03740 [Modestobacter caceresii]
MSTNPSKTKMKTTTPTAAELSRMAVTEARERFAIRQEADRQARETAEELVARLVRGDDTPTAADLSLADYAAKRTGLLVKAAEAKVKAAERAQLNDDTELAELFRPILADVYGGRVPVVVTGIPAEAKPGNDGDPLLFIVQPKPTHTAGGVLSGMVELVFFRPDLFAPLDVGKVEQQCWALGYTVQPHQLGTSPAGKMHRDGLRLTVHRASYPVPILSAAPSGDAVRDFALTVNGDLQQSVRTASKPPAITGEPVARRASSKLTGRRVVSSVPGDDGEVRVTVETTHEVTPGAGLPDGYANERLRQAVGQMDGQVADGVGRVVAAGALSITMPDLARPDFAQQAWTVRTRFILTYRPH